MPYDIMHHTAYIACAFVVLNILTFTLYGMDKRAAKNGGWRVSESTLLLLSLLGGSPAAFIASRHFRHKTAKNSFRVRFILIVVLQGCVVTFFLLQAL